MALQRPIFSKKERQVKINAIQSENGFISLCDIKHLLEDIDDDDEDTRQMLHDLEELATLEAQYNTTDKPKQRTKTAPLSTQKTPYACVKPKHAQRPEKRREESRALKQRPELKSTSGKLKLPHPPGFIPRGSQTITARTINTTTEHLGHSRSKLPPIPQRANCGRGSEQGFQSGRIKDATTREKGSVIPIESPREKLPTTLKYRNTETKCVRLPNIVRSHQNKTNKMEFIDNKTTNVKLPNNVKSRENGEPNSRTRLPPINHGQQSILSDKRDTSKHNAYSEARSKKDDRKNKRSQLPSGLMTKKRRARKVEPLIQPVFVF